MKEIINARDIKTSNNTQRCKLMISIIKGKALYMSNLKDENKLRRTRNKRI